MPIYGELSPQSEKQTDRKLGDEWEDWDGKLDPQFFQAPASVFLVAAALAVLFLAALGWFFTWLILPRFAAWGLAILPQGLAGIWTLYLASWYTSLILAAAGVKSAKAWVRKLGGTRWMVMPAMEFGRWLGFNRDRMGHAFVLAHNRAEWMPPPIRAAERLLVLVPRCLSKDTLQGLQTLKAKYAFSQVTVVGGTEARRAIVQLRPQGIIAVACERDLLSGVKDLRGRIPVLAFSNQRPEGPCKNTRVDLGQIESAIRRFSGMTPNEASSITG